MSTALQVAEAESEQVTAVIPDSNQEAYDYMLTHLQNLVRTARDLYSKWQWCIPSGDERNFCQGLRGLELNVNRLMSKKADFFQARREEEAERITPTPRISTYPLATIKLKPTALPKFTGNKRDFHRWKEDWEVLQKQGEPTGSREVKKVQLLDEKKCKITSPHNS